MERGQGAEGWENIRCSNNEVLNVTLASDYVFFKIQWRPQVLYVFGIVTEKADRISPWQCPNPWSWTMSMSIYWFNPKCCMFLELSQEMLMISDIGYTHICCYGHGNVHFWLFWVLLKLFLEAKRPPRAESSPERSGLPEYMNVTHDEWEAQSQKNL